MMESRRPGPGVCVTAAEIGSQPTGWIDGWGPSETDSRRDWADGGTGGDKESRRGRTGVYVEGGGGCPDMEWAPGDVDNPGGRIGRCSRSSDERRGTTARPP